MGQVWSRKTPSFWNSSGILDFPLSPCVDLVECSLDPCAPPQQKQPMDRSGWSPSPGASMSWSSYPAQPPGGLTPRRTGSKRPTRGRSAGGVPGRAGAEERGPKQSESVCGRFSFAHTSIATECIWQMQVDICCNCCRNPLFSGNFFQFFSGIFFIFFPLLLLHLALFAFAFCFCFCSCPLLLLFAFCFCFCICFCICFCFCFCFLLLLLLLLFAFCICFCFCFLLFLLRLLCFFAFPSAVAFCFCFCFLLLLVLLFYGVLLLPLLLFFLARV